jgi:hypothetical protein
MGGDAGDGSTWNVKKINSRRRKPQRNIHSAPFERTLADSGGSPIPQERQVTETTGSDATPGALNAQALEASASQDALPANGGHDPAAAESAADGEAHVEVEVEAMIEEIPAPPPSGFQAFLQHANLHNLLQIESLSRTTGVFLVVSQGRRGYLHLSNGELIHAETGGMTGEAAASEILAWGDGEFKSCMRPLAPTATIHSSLQALLLRLAKASDEATQYPERRTVPSPGAVARPIEEDKPTEPHLPAPTQADPAPPRPGSTAPRSGRLPPPLPPRIDRDSSNVAEVVISASGEIIHGRGAGPEELSARVAYAARLADLIGRAIRSGTPKALELRGKNTQTVIKWQADGTLSASLDLVQPGKR